MKLNDQMKPSINQDTTTFKVAVMTQFTLSQLHENKMTGWLYYILKT